MPSRIFRVQVQSGVLFSDAASSRREVEDGRKPKLNPLNENFEKKEFQELWRRINQKAVYRVEFDSEELVRNASAPR
jgi:type III restriction enzyme